ncbi:MAG: cytochrome c maturation protein CcmE [Gemmatimonadota bacterium]
MNRKRIWMLVGLAAIAGSIVFLVAGGLSENMVFFLTPSELQARAPKLYGASIRLGGQVKEGTVNWDAETRDLRFIVTDGEADVPVRSTGAPPAMFHEGMGVVVEGSYTRDDVFHSTNVMVKHSNEYRPPKPGEDPREVYKSLIREPGG